MTQKFAQDWLDETYPENTRGDIQHKITIRNAFSGVPLEGTLRLFFPRVKQIDCAINVISSLILDCPELEELEAHSNQIRTIQFLSPCPLLARVELKNNLLTEISLLNFFNSYKVEETGKKVIMVNPKNTTQRCSNCGKIANPKIERDVTIYNCSCGLVLDRDVNAAKNILSI